MDLAFAAAAAAVVVAAVGFEQRLFASGRAPRRGEAIVWSIGWLALAVAVAGGIALTEGPAGEWSTVSLIERSLSLDNVFLFSLLLAYFLVPPELRGRAIAIGIAGALLLRGVAIAAGLALIESVEAIVYAFGVLLLYVAFRAFRGAAEKSDPSANPVLRLFRRIVPTTSDFRGARLLVRDDGRLYGTPLLLVAVAIVVADIAFAVDSIPAAFAVTRDPVVIWTANAFALLGLGSLLAVVDILVRRFRYLDKTIALILAFVGIKILAADLVPVSDLGSLGAIGALVGRRRRLTRGGSSRPPAPGRRGDETPAPLPEGTQPAQDAGRDPNVTPALSGSTTALSHEPQLMADALRESADNGPLRS